MLTLGVAVFVLLASTITILGVQRAKSTSRLKAATDNEPAGEQPGSKVVLSDISGAATRDAATTGKPENKAATSQDRGPKTPTPPGPPPAASPPPSPTLPPDQPFDIYGPSDVTLPIGGSITVSFTTNDDSSVNWSGSGPEQTEIAAGFNDTTGPGYSVTFEALETAVVDTQVAFTIHVTDAARNIDITKTILVTIIK